MIQHSLYTLLGKKHPVAKATPNEIPFYVGFWKCHFPHRQRPGLRRPPPPLHAQLVQPPPPPPGGGGLGLPGPQRGRGRQDEVPPARVRGQGRPNQDGARAGEEEMMLLLLSLFLMLMLLLLLLLLLLLVVVVMLLKSRKCSAFFAHRAEFVRTIVHCL